MTDARIPDQWLGHPTYSDLSDQAWRFFTHSLQWSNRYGTDGAIASRYFNALGVFSNLKAVIMELQDAGLLTLTPTGIQLDWSAQSQAADVEARRESARIRSAKMRAKPKSADSPAKPSVQITPIESSQVTRDVTRDVGQDRTRTGQDRAGYRGG